MNLIAPNLDIETRSIRFELPPLPRLADLQSLHRLRARLDERVSGELNAIFRNRLETLRQRLLTMPFEEATNIAGRDRLLLKLYLLDQGVGYMRPFDEGICDDLLGDGSELRKISRLRQAADLFFAHFDHLPGHLALGRLLRNALARPDAKSHRLVQAKCWRESRESLFTTDGPQRFVAQVRDGEKLSDAADRCGVPRRDEGGRQPRFFELAQHEYLLASLLPHKLRRKDECPVFEELIQQRNTELGDGRLVGAAALEILILRSIAENAGRLPEKWGKFVNALNCDPRLPSCRRKWWSGKWAGETELAVGSRWFTGAELKVFLRLVRDLLPADAERMFERRERFLKAIEDAGKILDARLVLVDEAMLNARLRFPEQAAASFARMRAKGNAQAISVICLKLDGFYMVEGTHNFSLRLFREFPLAHFWERERSDFSLKQFQTGADARIPHLGGTWEWEFKNQLMQKFHIGWNDVRLW